MHRSRRGDERKGRGEPGLPGALSTRLGHQLSLQLAEDTSPERAAVVASFLIPGGGHCFASRGGGERASAVGRYINAINK